MLLSYPDFSRPNTIHVWSDNQWSLISRGFGSALGPDEVVNFFLLITIK